MLRYGGEDIVAGSFESIGVPKGEMHYLRIPRIPHFKDNKASIFDATDSLYGPTQGVGLPPLHVKVKNPKGIYLVQDKVKSCHGENRLINLDLILLLHILPVFSSFPQFVF